MNVHSDNGRYFVRITPGPANQSSHARGEFYKRHADRSYKLVADKALPHPVAPVEALMSNDGRLITFDNWHRVGFGKVVVIYKPDGQVLRAFDLEDLYDQEKIEKIPRSVSSRWWRCPPMSYSDPDGQTLVYTMERFGGSWQFDLNTGAHRYFPGGASCD
jgi:hypothetical protein